MSCATCSLSGPRQGEQHIAVRFGDRSKAPWTILLDDVDVTGDCIEAFAGRPGWVVVWVDGKPLCAASGGDHIETVRREGVVHVMRRPVFLVP